MRKTMFFAWITLIFGLVFITCRGGSDPTPQALPAPQIGLDGMVVYWEAVPRAGGYSVRIDGIEVDDGALGYDETSFNLAALELEPGEYLITLVALGVPGQSRDSEPSNALTLVVDPPVLDPQPLPAPVIALDGTVVSWAAVADAGGYSVRIGGTQVAGGALGATVTSFDLVPLNLGVGDHLVTVVAIGVTGQSLDSAPSNAETFTVGSSSINTNIAWTGFTNPMVLGVSVEVNAGNGTITVRYPEGLLTGIRWYEGLRQIATGNPLVMGAGLPPLVTVMAGTAGSDMTYSLVVTVVGDYIATGDSLFIITSPYEAVDWDTWGQYRAALHTHTTNSDGAATLPEMVNRHFELGFDVLAITDHVWRRLAGRASGDECFRNLLTRCPTQQYWPGYVETGVWGNVPLSHITQERLDQLLAGYGRDGRGMVIIPGTAELAPGSGGPMEQGAENNVFFWQTEEKPPSAWAAPNNTIRAGVAAAQRNGAITFINHPGRTTGGLSYTIGETESPNNPSNRNQWIRHYADLFMEFSPDHLVGLEIFNRRDGDSRHDRVLWDNILTRTVPHGRFVWGFANDDTHSNSPTSSSSIGTNANIFLMPENNLDNIKSTMRGGNFYIVTHVARNEGVSAIAATANAHPQPQYLPSITSIAVDHDAYTITIVADNAVRIDWISEGRVIQTTDAGTSTISLADPEIIDEVGVYVRANIFGPANRGMALIQPIGTRRVNQ